MQITIEFDESGKILPYSGGRLITMDESPFLIFLASAGMCSAVYVRAFMAQRGMSLEGVSLTETISYNRMTNMVETINIHAELPPSFPGKYKNAVKSAIAQCPVKRHLGTPPNFEIQTSLDLVKSA
ncbi:MAG: OsmC family protein [Flavobacteriaceae bacterium]